MGFPKQAHPQFAVGDYLAKAKKEIDRATRSLPDPIDPSLVDFVNEKSEALIADIQRLRSIAISTPEFRR